MSDTYQAVGYDPNYSHEKIIVPQVGRFSPQDDITAIEAVKIAALLAVATNHSIIYSYIDYIKTHKLERHFS
jgi:hypothetical protein